MRSSSILRVTALEFLSEPLTLLVLLAALALTVLAPVFHYHQFGEATRMARDAGFSSVFLAGSVLSIFGTIRAFRREIESGTIEMALARPVSRPCFFLSKVAGVFLANAFVLSVVVLTMLVVVEGAAVGGRVAERTGELARVWGPCEAIGVAVLVLPLVAAAALNRFARRRFVLSSIFIAFVLSLLGGGWALARDPSELLRYVPALLPLVFVFAILVSAASSFAVRFAAHASAALSGLVFLFLIFFVGNYYRAEELTGGGVVPALDILLAGLAALPAVVGFLSLGARMESRT